jgi:WD40 repeat protein
MTHSQTKTFEKLLHLIVIVFHFNLIFFSFSSRFLSCSYDRIVRLWDTETGKCIQALSTGKIPYCVKFPPNPDQQNAILVGQSDKKIIQVLFQMKPKNSKNQIIVFQNLINNESSTVFLFF